eukprot:3181300-Ditylum_brightwellii.AAC.1
MFVHATTLAEAKFKLKTALGVSEEFYKHCKAFPIYGTGQGSTKSLIIWLIEGTVCITMVGFIDDAMGQTNKFSNNNVSPNKLINMIKQDAQL